MNWNNVQLLLLRIAERSRIPEVTDVIAEQKRIALVRIFIGVVVMLRHVQIAWALYTVEDWNKLPISLAAIGIALCFTVGLLTPISTLLLIAAGTVADFKIETLTLGTTVLHLVLITLLFANHGKYYSLDAWLLKSKSSRFTQRLYDLVGDPNAATLKLICLLMFYLYGLCSLVAIAYHLRDEMWLSGHTVQLLFTSSFWSRYYEFFRGVESFSPTLFRYNSILIGILQTIFQLFMIPLMFTRLGGWFVKWWGWIFIISSLFLLQLSYLPYAEIALWLIVFHRSNTLKQKIGILYDDYCNLCKNAIGFFKTLDFNHSLQFLPASKNKNLAEQYNVSDNELYLFMNGVYNNQIVRGYDLYLLIFRYNPLYWPLLPFMYLGKWTTIGPWIYKWIAQNRYKLFGTCELSYEPTAVIRLSSSILFHRWKLLFAYYVLFAPLFLFFFLPGVNPRTNSVLGRFGMKPLTDINPVGYATGLIVPLVFNATDLTCGERWFVVHRLDSDGAHLLPLNRTDGSRGSYQNFNYFLFKNHNSDYLYFGSTLLQRRDLSIGAMKSFEKENSVLRKALMRMLAYDYRYNHKTGDVRYRYALYGSDCTDVTLSPELRYGVEELFADTVTINDSMIERVHDTHVLNR